MVPVTPVAAIDADGASPQPIGRARTLALIVVACALVMDILDLTIVNVAIPTLQTRLHASEAEVQWMVAGYAGVFSTLLVTGGRLGDIYGYRRMMMIGMSGFTFASLLCGIAPGSTTLVAARLAQGAMAAMMLPQIMSLVQRMYPPHERIGALGAFGILGGTAGISGPLIGGLLISADLFGLGWRPIFLVNLPVGVANLVAAWYLLPRGRSEHKPRLDIPGTLLVTLTLAAIMVPLVEGRALGGPAWCFALLAAAPFLAFLLLRYSRWRMAHDGSPAILTFLFRQYSFRLGMAMIALYQASIAGFQFIFTQMLQVGLGFTPGVVGIVHAPYAIGSALGIGFLSRKALPRVGARLLSGGAAAMVVSLAGIVWRVNAGAVGQWSLMPMTFGMGLGMGMLAGPLTPIILSDVDVDHAGGASGMVKSTQEIGGAIGVATIGGLFFTVRDRGGGAASVASFSIAAAVIATGIAIVGLMALRVPRSLRIFAARPKPTIA